MSIERAAQISEMSAMLNASVGVGWRPSKNAQMDKFLQNMSKNATKVWMYDFQVYYTLTVQIYL